MLQIAVFVSFLTKQDGEQRQERHSTTEVLSRRHWKLEGGMTRIVSKTRVLLRLEFPSALANKQTKLGLSGRVVFRTKVKKKTSKGTSRFIF